MSELPYMQFYPAKYLADTQHLTTLEHGAYLLLIFNYWQRGAALPNDDKKLATITRLPIKDWLKVKPTMAEFFQVSLDEWRHGRIEADILAIDDRRSKSTDAAELSKLARQLRKEGMAEADVKREVSARSSDLEAIRKEKKRKENIPPTPTGGLPDNFLDFDEKKWREVMAAFTRTKFDRVWSKRHGPEPGCPGCAVPAHIQAEFGFTPTLEIKSA